MLPAKLTFNNNTTPATSYSIQWADTVVKLSDLSPVRLSQNVARPSVFRVTTHVCEAPRSLVPTQTYASRPKPRRSEHSRTEWSSQSYTPMCLMVKFINYDRIFLHTLTFRLPPEVFVRRIKTSFLHPVLSTVSNRCAKKVVLHLTELVAALLTVHSSLSLLVDVDRLLDPSGGSVWFPVYQRCVTPLYHMVFL